MNFSLDLEQPHFNSRIQFGGNIMNRALKFDEDAMVYDEIYERILDEVYEKNKEQKQGGGIKRIAKKKRTRKRRKNRKNTRKQKRR